MHWVLKRERAQRELAEIVVYSMKCMGRDHAPYVLRAIKEKQTKQGGARRGSYCKEIPSALAIHERIVTRVKGILAVPCMESENEPMFMSFVLSRSKFRLQV
jgi:hypothetical protein